MLGNMSDASKIGSSMALALLTTLYGAMLAYTIFFPLASKLDRNSKEHSLISMIYLQAFISIAKKENPRSLEVEINSILSPIKAIQYFKDL
jgi:chemotaxis protein MotA